MLLMDSATKQAPLPIFRTTVHAELRLATLEVEQGHYLDLVALLALVPKPNHAKFAQLLHDHRIEIADGFGSSHNHQAWKGGYLDHVTETMNLACQLYRTLGGLRKLPFHLHEALEVMFLHDIEKPFKVGDKLLYGGTIRTASKGNRKELRATIIQEYGIALTSKQYNALRYVEGVPDSEYTPGERTMGELAAFCHCCDILSARMWHDKGKDVPAPDWE
jgi:hypothetical protein